MNETDNTPDNVEAALENLARFVQVIGNDPELLQWFRNLEGQTTTQRNNEILIMAEKIRSQNQYRDLSASLALLSHPIVFDGLSQTLRECGYIQ